MEYLWIGYLLYIILDADFFSGILRQRIKVKYSSFMPLLEKQIIFNTLAGIFYVCTDINCYVFIVFPHFLSSNLLTS